MKERKLNISNLKRATKRQRLALLLVLSVSVLLVSGIIIASHVVSVHENNRHVEDIRNEYHQRLLQTTPTQSSASTIAPTPTPKVMLGEFTALYEHNEDIIGWLTIEGTDIDYPVMQTMSDRDFYLDKNFDKEHDDNGTLYVDTMCDVFNPSTNIIIYGHNMKSGKMFGDLDDYSSESYYNEHKYITFNTLYEHGMYEVAAVFTSQVYKKSDDVFKYYQFYDAQTQAEFDYFTDKIKELSLYETDATLSFSDTFITLSTCAYHDERGTFVVVAKRVN